MSSAHSHASPAPPLFSRSELHPAALAWADAHARDDAPWCAAFSGGADSLALLIALREHYPQKKLLALHFNHHLRGKDSDDDQDFCRRLCDRLGVEIDIGHWRRANAAAAISEAEAREHRHRYLETQMSARAANALWLGHQRDDIAETQLMRLARGSSTAGLAAPRPVHHHADGRVFLRPLLTLSKKQITDALRSRGLAWREDATNLGGASGDYYRNRIRRDVLPAWTAAAENDALAGAALTRELLDEDATALETWLDELLPASAIAPPTLDLRALAGKPRALLRRALRRWPPAAQLARAGIETLLDICAAGQGRIGIAGQLATLENGILRLAPAQTPPAPRPRYSLTLAPGATITLPDGATLASKQITLTDTQRAEILAGHHEPINTIFISAPLRSDRACTVRPWRAGDRYHPLGAPGSAKISDLFINRKIPRARRLTLPVVCITPRETTDSCEILWVPGLPPAHAWKITAQTQQALHLTYQCGTCTVNH